MRLILLFAPALTRISTLGPRLIVLILLVAFLVTTLRHVLALTLTLATHHIHEARRHLSLHTCLLEHVLEGIWVNLTTELRRQ